MKDKKIKGIILTILSVVIILGILIGLGIQIYLINYNYRKYEFKVTVNSLDILLGNESVVPISLVNEDSLNYNDFTYTSSDESIIKVDEDGKIISVNKGSAKLIVKAKKSNQQEIINVNVLLVSSSVNVEDLNVDNTNVILKVGDTHTVAVEVIPNDASINTFIWSSSNTSVASVVDGVITAKNEGICVIYVKCGDIKKEINVTVSK